MKKIKLTEKDLTKIIKNIIKEQHSDWEHSSDTWQNQKKARDKKKYCKGSTLKMGHYDGQYCNIETNWRDWETKSSVITGGVSDGGKWSCRLNACVAAFNTNALKNSDN